MMEPLGETITSREIGLMKDSSESEQGSSSELEGESLSELVKVWSGEPGLEWSELEVKSDSEGEISKLGLI